MSFKRDFSIIPLINRFFVISKTSLLILLLIIQACSGVKYLNDGQKILYKQNINHETELSNYELNNVLSEKVNVRFPPYVSIYKLGERFYDSSKFIQKKKEVVEKFDKKIERKNRPAKKDKLEQKKQRKLSNLNEKLATGNNLMNWGEELVIYDTSKVVSSVRNLKQYLFNHGYFESEVNAETSFGKGLISSRKRKKIVVDYNINSGSPYLIDTFYYRSTDSVIIQLLNESKSESIVKKGQLYNQDKLVKERERIEFYLKDHGFYDFSRNYLSIQIDTTMGDNKAMLRFNIGNPSNGKHKIYRVDSVIFVVNTPLEPNRTRPKPETFNNTTYSFYEDIYSEKVLERRIFIQKDSLYSRTETFNTQRRLANLDNFKFININYDSSGGKFISHIFTSPLSRYQWSHELGLNVTQGFPGPFYNLSLKKRNIFRGLENFEINGRFGIEGVATPGNVGTIYQNREYGVNASLTFPQFVLPIGERLKEAIGQVNPKTRLLAGYTDIDRFDYRRRNFNFSNTYSWQSDERTFYSLSLLDLSIINTIKLSDEFRQALLEQNSRLINSFEPSFVSNINFNYRRTNSFTTNNKAAKTNSFSLSVESGGAALNFYGIEYLEAQGLEHFQYGRLNVDYSQNIPLTSFSSFAYRGNFGLALPYGDNSALPYEKYLFAGGSNGIRAWRPRRLGPGSYTQIDDEGNASYDREQQGEVLLQASIEYRRDLFGLIDYALFIDAGNIWMASRDDSRSGSQIEKDFWEEIAVGTGLGLRFDFSFLVFRLDIGIKTYDPARSKGNRWLFSPGFNSGPYENLPQTEKYVINIAVGYPF